MALALPFPVDPPDPDRPNVGRLGDEWRRLQRRYGVPSSPPVERYQDRVQGHRVRLERIEEQLAELEAERRRLTQELTAWEKAIALTLGEEIDRIRERHAEAWSPSAVKGYRVWNLIGDRLHGARAVWSDPWFEARCAGGGGNDDEVPHSDGRCGRLGCGVYAAKRAEALIEILSGYGILGLVDLTGKVVEHQHGYRARYARVVALGALIHGRVLLTDDPSIIAAVFHDPVQATTRWGERRTDRPWTELVRYLADREQMGGG